MGRKDHGLTFGEDSPFQKPFAKRKRTSLKTTRGGARTLKTTKCTGVSNLESDQLMIVRERATKMEYVTVQDIEGEEMFVTDLIDDEVQVEGPCDEKLAPTTSGNKRKRQASAAEGLLNLPGFRFSPKDDELVGYWLRSKAEGILTHTVVGDLDLYAFEPWELPDLSTLGSSDMEWYFFTYRGNASGRSNNRGTKAGYWKATGRDKEVEVCGTKMGLKKTLVFYKGRAPNGERTDWVMHEYRIEEAAAGRDLAWVVCRVTDKTGLPAQRNSRQRGVGGARVDEAYELLRTGSEGPAAGGSIENWSRDAVIEPLSGSIENWSFDSITKPEVEETLVLDGFVPVSKFEDVSDDENGLPIELDQSDVDSPIRTSLYKDWEESTPIVKNACSVGGASTSAQTSGQLEMAAPSVLSGGYFVDLMGVEMGQMTNAQCYIDISTSCADIALSFEELMQSQNVVLPDFLLGLDNLEEESEVNGSRQSEGADMGGLLCPPMEVFDFDLGEDNSDEFY